MFWLVAALEQEREKGRWDGEGGRLGKREEEPSVLMAVCWVCVHLLFYKEYWKSMLTLERKKMWCEVPATTIYDVATISTQESNKVQRVKGRGRG